MNFRERIGRALLKPIFSGYGGSSGLGWFGFRGVDVESEVGPLWKSGIPLSCLKFEQRACIELQIVVQKTDENDDWVNVPKHRALKVLRNPNPFHTSAQLFNLIRWDYRLSGNAYLYKVRSASGRLIELWWIPAEMIDPRWEEGGNEFISCYEYRVNGQVFALPVDDVIHFRNGGDPRWQGRKGLGEFEGVLGEVMSDNQASLVVASLMKNRGMPGVIISPATGAPNGGQALDKAQRQQLREYWDEEFTGPNLGRPFIHNIPIKIDFPAYNPQQLLLDKIRAIPEQRIAGAFGLPLSVLQLGSGLENSNSRANKSDDRKQAYESCIIPASMALAEDLTRGVLLEFGCDITEYRVWFDTSDVSCLAEDKVALWKALSEACGGPFMTPDEARKQAGFKPIEGGKALRKGKAQVEQNTDKTEESDQEDENHAQTKRWQW